MGRVGVSIRAQSAPAYPLPTSVIPAAPDCGVPQIRLLGYRCMEISLQYHSNEDRILLFTVDKGVVDEAVWLSRRLTRMLIKALADNLEASLLAPQIPTEHRSDALAFEHSGSIDSKPLQWDSKPIPEQAQERRAAITVHMKWQDSGVWLSFVDGADQQCLEITLDRASVHGFVAAIGRTSETAQWDLALPAWSDSGTEAPTSNVLH